MKNHTNGIGWQRILSNHAVTAAQKDPSEPSDMLHLQHIFLPLNCRIRAINDRWIEK